MLVINDRTLSSSLLVFSAIFLLLILLIGIRNIYLISLPIFLIISLLVFRKYLFGELVVEEGPRVASTRASKLLFIVFLLLFSIGLLVFVFRDSVYIRPVEYHIIMGMMLSLVAAQIFLVRTKPVAVLLQIFLISLSIVATQYLLFPAPIGKDVWYFAYETRLLVEGAPWYGGNYRYTPFFVYWEGMSVILSGLEYNLSRLISTIMFQILTLNLLVYSISKKVFMNRETTLVSCFLLSLSPVFISYGLKATPFSFATILVLAALFLLFVTELKKSKILLLLLFLYFTAMFTHNLSAILLTGIFIVYFPANRLFHRGEERPRHSIALYMIPVVTILSLWTYVGNQITRLAGLLSIGFDSSWDQTDTILKSTDLIILTEPIDILLQSLYPLALIPLSIIGLLIMISRRGSIKMKLLSLIVIIPLATLLFQFLFSVSFVEERWVYYSYIFMAFPAAYGLISLSRGSLNLKRMRLAITLFLIMIAIFSILGPANYDNSYLTPNTQIRPSLEMSEVQGMIAISEFRSGIITSDSYYIQGHLTLYYGILHSERAHMDSNLASGEFKELKGRTILIRHHIMEGPFELTRTYKTLSYDPTYNLQEQGFNRIYSSDRVSVYR